MTPKAPTQNRICRSCKLQFVAQNKRYWYCAFCSTGSGLTYTQRAYRSNWARSQVSQKRYASKKRGWSFDLTEDDLQIPDKCPVLGIPLQINYNISNKDNSPSIDKIDPSKGYTKDNVAVISMKANRIKNDASLEELEKVCSWLRRLKL
jgi:hypothetical protein